MISRLVLGASILLIVLSACGPTPVSTVRPTYSEAEILATAAAIQTNRARSTRSGQHNRAEDDWQFDEWENERWQATQDALYDSDLAAERAIGVDTEEASQKTSGLISRGTPTPNLDHLASEAPWLLDTFAKQNANLRGGPGTEYPIEGVVPAGQALLIIGQTPTGDWLQVDPGFWWIARWLVSGADEINWPVVYDTSAEPRSGPTVQDCLIKGNISQNTGERIYHVPGGEWYDETNIHTEYGERWFCTEAEAQAAGWRRSYE